MRTAAIVALILLAGMTGCLSDGDAARIDRSNDTGDALSNQTTGPEANLSDDAAPGPGHNATTNATTNRSANGDQNSTSPEPTLPGNLTMEDADIVARSDDRVVFRWESQLDPTTEEPALTERAAFEVPDGIPLWVNASLSWNASSDLDLAVTAPGVDYCESRTILDPAVEGGTEACQVRTFARSAWDTWGVTIKGNQNGNDAAARPTSFTAMLTIEVAQPWTGRPVAPTNTSQAAPVDPGWPAIEDATIRPSVKAGVSGSGLNGGTANFIFSSPDNRTLYLGWVAHGVDGLMPGDTIMLPTVGVEATVAYCSWGIIEETVTCPSLTVLQHPRFFNDFALLELPDEARSKVHPATLIWGGPTELAPPPAQGTQLMAAGNTPFRDAGQQGVNALDAIRGVLWSSTQTRVETHLTPQPVPGDSGSPVLAVSGQAVGTLSAVGSPVARPGQDPGNVEATTILGNLHNEIEVMEAETALDVELKTWPVFETPRLGDLADPSNAPKAPER